MKRYIISFALLLFTLFPTIAEAYDRHGRDYSVRDSDGGASAFIAILVVIGVVFIGYCSGGKDK